MPRFRYLAPFAIPLVLACGFGKVAECNKLIQAANGQQEAVKAASNKLSGGGVPNPSDIENLASTMENAAKAIAAVEVKDQKLKTFRDQYRDMLNKAGKDCRDLVAATKSKNLAAIQAASQALSGLGPEETKLISGINGYCTGGS